MPMDLERYHHKKALLSKVREGRRLRNKGHRAYIRSIVNAIDEGLSYREVAEVVQTNPGTLFRWVERWRGELVDGKVRGQRREVSPR